MRILVASSGKFNYLYLMDCIFCKIVNKEAESKIVLEDDFYMAFYSIKPQAPIHLIIIPKEHIDKKEMLAGFRPGVYEGLMNFTGNVIRIMRMDKSGYRIVSNGAGYNAIDHEHIHLLGGENWKPKDDI